jgi:hypothetical protein
MNQAEFNLGSLAQKILFLIGCIGFISIVFFDKTYFDIYLLQEGRPNFTFDYGLRGIAICLSSAVILLSFVGKKRPELQLAKSLGASFELRSILISLIIAVVILLLFLFKPVLFNTLSMEDNIIEWGSALFLFGSFFITMLAFFKNRRVAKVSNLTRLALIGLSLVFFVMAMEEVSWFQRVIEVETPELFEGNQQKEMNLHNYYTDYTENVYYFGAFIFLVIFPFLRSQLSFISNIKFLNALVPRPFIAVIGAIFCAYNYDMWNIVFTQLTFYSSLVVLSVFAFLSTRKNERSIIFLAILVVIASQVSFLALGENFNRLWEITEYKELFMPIAFFVYTLDVLFQLRQRKTIETAK